MKHSFLDRYSDMDSWIHSLDPRAKFISFFTAIVLMVAEPRGEVLCFIYYFVLIFFIIGLSRIPLHFYLKRLSITLPFILFAALLLPFSYLFSNEKEASFPVANMALSLGLKAIAAVLLLLILTSTGKFHRLLKGLRKLKMPDAIGQISAVMYRYIFILNDERLRALRAKESRTPGKLRTSAFRVYGHLAAQVFLRSWERAHIVYNSMLSRGFTGNFPEYEEMSIRAFDVVFSIIFIAGFCIIRIWL